jgi:methylated-DNA-[protein]-cysteine S-methyltransferase
MTRKLYYSVFLTAAGWVGILSSHGGLKRVILPRQSEREVRASLDDDTVPAPESLIDLKERFIAYFSGRETEFPDKLDLSGATPFQRRVWQAARLIPYGQTRSYQWLASQIGQPGAARAVGQALGKNPLPVVIPCHRVLASGGGLGGFSAGIDMKKYLLELEKNRG